MVGEYSGEGVQKSMARDCAGGEGMWMQEYGSAKLVVCIEKRRWSSSCLSCRR